MFWQKKKKTIIKLDYIVLILGLAILTFLYLQYTGQSIMRIGIVIITGLFYTLWGIIHHTKEGDFHIKIALEYFLIALVAVVILLSLIFQS